MYEKLSVPRSWYIPLCRFRYHLCDAEFVSRGRRTRLALLLYYGLGFSPALLLFLLMRLLY